MIRRFSSVKSMTEPQASQATDSVRSIPRKVMGLPHPEHFSVFTCGEAGAGVGAVKEGSAMISCLPSIDFFQPG
jgi:hypothetical protein